MKNKHTPGPYIARIAVRPNGDEIVVAADLNGGGLEVAICGAANVGPIVLAETWSNARFIAQGCNAHDDLLAACKWALPLVVQWFNEKPHCQDHSGLTALREAIAKGTQT